MALTGFAGLLYEVSWTRAIALLLGPTTYAFAGTVCALIAGLALGGALGRPAHDEASCTTPACRVSGGAYCNRTGHLVG